MGTDFRVGPTAPRLALALPSRVGASRLHNLTAPQLVAHVLSRGEAELSSNGALVVRTGELTGRSPAARFIVRNRATADRVAWGTINQPMTPERAEAIRLRVTEYLGSREVFVQDCYVGSDPNYRVSMRVVTELAWHALVARNIFWRPPAAALAHLKPEWTMIVAPGCHALPAEDATPGRAFVILDFENRTILIGGTSYAGEIKTSIFAVLNFLLPGRGVLPLHGAANVGSAGDGALFLGLSGTGKTALSADPERPLIGDDELGWTDTGMFSFEGGCYARCIHLSRRREPEIWDAIRFGTVLENVVLRGEDREPDFDDDRWTENTRATYPLDFTRAWRGSSAPHPRHIVLLSADAFGVMPPIARLTHDQALYHFLAGYTANLGGTEAGVHEPRATFSACFGEPFLPLTANTYVRILADRLRRHPATCWLINTGWSGGGYGQGDRIPLDYTRTMVQAALSGRLEDVPVHPDPFFHGLVPSHVPGVPDAMLQPWRVWPDPNAYARSARALVTAFQNNLSRFGPVPDEVAAAGPTLGPG